MKPRDRSSHIPYLHTARLTLEGSTDWTRIDRSHLAYRKIGGMLAAFSYALCMPAVFYDHEESVGELTISEPIANQWERHLQMQRFCDFGDSRVWGVSIPNTR